MRLLSAFLPAIACAAMMLGCVWMMRHKPGTTGTETRADSAGGGQQRGAPTGSEARHA